MGNPLSDKIASIIEEMLEENGGELELQRNKLASFVGCVPSQINYVITSRFNTGRGYMVESRRGGGGFVRITKITFDGTNPQLMHTLAAIGGSIDCNSAKAVLISLYDSGIISETMLSVIYSAISDSALSLVDRSKRDSVRADILRSVILTLRANNI